jgi:hypothetical protein
VAIIAAGSALQLNVHFHILVPEGLFAAPSPGTGTRATFLPLPPPTDDEVKALLRTVMHRVVDLLNRRGCLDGARGRSPSNGSTNAPMAA